MQWKITLDTSWFDKQRLDWSSPLDQKTPPRCRLEVHSRSFGFQYSQANSPGHRPRACQSPGTNPQSWLLFPSGTGLQLLLESRRIRIIVSLGGGSGLQPCHINDRNPVFKPFKNHSRNRSVVHRCWKPKCSHNPSKNNPKSIPRDIPKPIPKTTTKIYRS